MSFTPSTNIYIGSVPFDPSYKNVRYFSSRSEQQAWFASRCTDTFKRGDYTYQRLDNTVVVPYNAEQLYGYNYCMFQNANYGSRWFYSFIVDIEYVNERSSRLYLQIDIMQTWFLDVTLPACIVEREHVNDDTIGRHIKDEGFTTGEMVCTYTAYDESSLYTIVASAVEPLADGTYVNCEGDIYSNVTSGTSLTAFNMDLDDNRGQFKRFMQGLADNGQQDGISAIYMVPSTVCPGFASKSNGYGAWVKGDNEPANEKILSWNLGFTTLNGYTPKNNKCYCYPFEYAEISNLMGQNQQFALEFWSNKGTVTLKRTGGVDVNAGQVYIPQGYNGMDEFWEGAVNMPTYPTCNWVYQSFNNYLGMHEANGYGVMGWNSATELPYYNAIFGGGLNSLLSIVGLGKTGGALRAASSTSNTSTGAKAGAVSTGSQSLGMIAQIAQANSDLNYQSRQPNTSRGGTNSSVTLANIDAYKLAVRKFTVRAEIAEQIDDFFSMYGYNVSVMKKPNITGRRSWNFVKTIGANVQGKIPAPAKQVINNLLDNGCTFWHIDDIGNYLLDNSIV